MTDYVSVVGSTGSSISLYLPPATVADLLASSVTQSLSTTISPGPALSGGGSVLAVSVSSAASIVGGIGEVMSQAGLPMMYNPASLPAGSDTITAVTGHITVSGALSAPMTFTGTSGLMGLYGEAAAHGGSVTGAVFNAGSVSVSLLGGAAGDVFIPDASSLPGGSHLTGFTLDFGTPAGVTEITLGTFGAGFGDTVVIKGFGANQIQTALASQVHANGATTITLSDSTKITFVGITPQS